MDNNKEDILALILESQKADQISISKVLDKQDLFSPNCGQSYEGRLAVDVYDTVDYIIILAPMAGVEPDSVNVSLHEDILSIRGTRVLPTDMENITQSFHRECYWGQFSRSIVLPVDVVSGAAVAEFRHGLLTVRIPKAHQSKVRNIPIEIVEE